MVAIGTIDLKPEWREKAEGDDMKLFVATAGLHSSEADLTGPSAIGLIHRCIGAFRFRGAVLVYGIGHPVLLGIDLFPLFSILGRRDSCAPLAMVEFHLEEAKRKICPVQPAKPNRVVPSTSTERFVNY
jgi:hypothetical protein